jgi:pimeloyl-ACP methyl ester carboxylesterase
MRSRVLPLVVVVASSLACVEERLPVRFELPREGALGVPFLATPWPSDVMITSTGTLDLSRIPNPYGSDSLEDVLSVFATNTAYPATGTLYFQIEGGVDEKTLPQTPAASLANGSAMFLVETTTLRKVPIVWRHYPEATSFLPAGAVAVQPLLGAVPKGRFALVVTSNARHASGPALGPSPELLALLRCDQATLDALPPEARRVDCAPYAQLIDDLDLPADSAALVQMVTPLDATGGLVRANDVVRALPPPTVTRLARRAGSPSGAYIVIEGTAAIAQLQAGEAPYDTLDRPDFVDGGFVLDDEGNPIVQRFEEVDFTLTIPDRAMPANGFCTVINGHGTGGDLNSGLGDGPGAEAFQAAQAGCALLTTSEPLHFGREGYVEGQEEILTFNFFNPVAGRDNWRQSAIEKVQLVSLATSGLVVPSDVAGGTQDVLLDPARVSYFGHSQGGITGALFVALEDRIQGAFLSGAGAGFQASLVEKVDPVAIKDAIKVVIGIPRTSDDDIDVFHPVIALLQSWVDPADPINYGALWRTRSGPVPHLVATSGLTDTFTPPGCHAGLAASFGLPLAKPVAQELPVLALLGVPEGAAVLDGNLESADGAPLTAGLLQYPDDGHFAVFSNPDAQGAMREFFTTLQQGVPSVRVE